PKVMGSMLESMPIRDANHAVELFYLFKKGIYATPTLTEEDKHVMNIFTTAFTNFAKYGNPNGSDDHKSDLPVHW
ncbi:hypothetical protein PENTCL1PPCAC_142, partial [Pristionchus entomophagus]